MFKRITVFLLVSITFYSCETDDEPNHINNYLDDGYDRSGMLMHWVDNIIIPAYDAFYNTLLDLDSSIDQFIDNPTVDNLQQTSGSWLEAYKYWQYIEMFNIGKAETIYYKEKTMPKSAVFEKFFKILCKC